MTKYIFTAYPHLKQIDKYSKRVAKLLFKKYPHWLPYASVGNWNNESYLDVKVPAPVRGGEQDLLLSTQGERFTIYFDQFHTHFYTWSGLTLADAFEDAVQFLEALFREEIVVHITMVNEQVTAWRAGTPDASTGGMTQDSSQNAHYRSLVSLSGGAFRHPQTVTATQSGIISYSRSWRGTFNSTQIV